MDEERGAGERKGVLTGNNAISWIITIEEKCLRHTQGGSAAAAGWAPVVSEVLSTMVAFVLLRL